MNEFPELGEDAIVRVSRQGGVAAIQALTRPREIEFAQCDPQQRSQICSLLSGCMPLAAETGNAGRGDQRFYQIELSYRLKDQAEKRIIKVPENSAPSELVRLWDKGEVV
ncbi:protealysin inhibitor emfourin [Pseudomonas sp. nanlin1]|uniref:protealysin inhibitor emfourin n=1 Tax=Pseudomonas sp. nanlin1 TaxID=3040605 RepID=UPI00388ECD59